MPSDEKPRKVQKTLTGFNITSKRATTDAGDPESNKRALVETEVESTVSKRFVQIEDSVPPTGAKSAPAARLQAAVNEMTSREVDDDSEDSLSEGDEEPPSRTPDEILDPRKLDSKFEFELLDETGKPCEPHSVRLCTSRP